MHTYINTYLHTTDKHTDRQTHIPMFVLVTLHRHGGGLGRGPLDIVKKKVWATSVRGEAAEQNSYLSFCRIEV